jgi:hypothetical protein
VPLIIRYDMRTPTTQIAHGHDYGDTYKLYGEMEEYSIPEIDG